MAKKLKLNKDGSVKILPGTYEHEAQKFFEREKAAYEERTGEKVTWEPPHPVTQTPLPEGYAAAGDVVAEESEDAVESDDAKDEESAEGDA